MERTLKIKLWKDMLKGTVKSIVAKEPEFGYVTRSVRFDQHKNGIKVTVENVFDEVKDTKEMVLNFGEAWCFFEQAVYRAESIDVSDDEDRKYYCLRMKDHEGQQ